VTLLTIFTNLCWNW